MRLLLDECVPARLARQLAAHDVTTVLQRGWSGTRNGALLALAAEEFDVLITVDKNLPYQQNNSTLPLAVIVLDSVSNELHKLVEFIADIEAALAKPVKHEFIILRHFT